MKSSQWIGALVVLILMVFGITFAMNFLNTAKPLDGPPGTGPEFTGPPGRQLTFFIKTIPVDPFDSALNIYHEEKTTGYVDFPFENPHGEDVPIGLIKKGCRCTSVEVLLASSDWKARRSVLAAGETLAPLSFLFSSPRFAEDVSLRLQPLREKGLQDIQRGLTVHAKLEPEGTKTETVVPAKAVGFIRLAWNKDKVGIDRFKGEFWIDRPDSGIKATLEAEVHFVPPATAVHNDVKVNELNEVVLEKKPYEGSFLVWSPIRPALHLKAEVIELPRYKRFDPFKIGQPVPLPEKDLEAFRRTTPGHAPAPCAYYIPFKLYGRSPEGKVAIDLGAFRRRVKVWTDEEEGIEPMELTVTGSVQGSVLIGDAFDQGRVSLASFDSHTGSREQALPVTGKVPGVKLALDKERTPEFLHGSRLVETEPVAGLPRWKLIVQVKPDAARGHFPRPEDVQYQDSAVYLKVLERDVEQNVRVPVEGDATSQ